MSAEPHPALSAPEDIDITALRGADRLLVALDFDGVIAPLQDDPGHSSPLPDSAAAVEALSRLPDTAVGYISGRNIAALKELSRAPGRTLYVGSHGVEQDFAGVEIDAQETVEAQETVDAQETGEAAETSDAQETGEAAETSDAQESPIEPDPFRYAAAPTDEERELLAALDEAFERISAATPDTGDGDLRLERKPLGRTFHTRGISRDRAEFFAAELRRLADELPQLRAMRGHDMVEFGVRMHTKGDGLRIMVERSQATAAVYIGDDTTDEDAFAFLAEQAAEGFPALSIKVGPGQTRAVARLESPDAVAEFLARLARERAAPA